MEGTVVVGLIVKADGTTANVHAVSGPGDSLNQAAVDAVNQWKFAPATYQGKPVDVEIKASVNFKLEANPPQPTQSSQQAASTRDQISNLYTNAAEASTRGDYQTAVNICQRIVEVSPQDSNAWNMLGRSLLALNEPEAAANALETSIKLYPANSMAYNNLGLALWRQYKYDDAAVQFRKQIVINADDHYAHSNLGMMLRDQRKCKEAMPELEKGLAISPNRPDVLIALGDCNIDLGKREQGIAELEQAISASSSPGTRNNAAYVLAKQNIELDRAERWSDSCLSMESPRLQNISLDRLTPEQLNYVTSITANWDTRGFIYFERGDYAAAESYLHASWYLYPSVATGNHLAQVYEKTNRKDEAIRTYAMAIASADRLARFKANEQDVADAKERLAKIDPNINKLVSRGRTELAELTTVSFPNSEKANSQGDFTLLLSGDTLVETRRISGDVALDAFKGPLQAVHLSIKLPKDAKVQVPLRGTLTCKSNESQCRLAFFTPDAAVDLARKEMATNVPPFVGKSESDPHIYDSHAMGMRITLPDEWVVIKDEPGSFSRPHTVMFGKPGSLAMFMLAREHLEGTPELYKKALEAGFSHEEQYQRNGEESVTRDGLSGTRWSITMNKNNITYFFLTEFFTVGDDHYRLTAFAPKEIYDRYAEGFANIMRSVTFPLLHTEPRVLEGQK